MKHFFFVILTFTIFINFFASYARADDKKASLPSENDLLIHELEADFNTGEKDESFLSDDELLKDKNLKNQEIFDPLEPLNRGIFYFNDKVYTYIFTPVSNGYKKVTPKFARTGIRNFFKNLGAPLRIINNLLQGKMRNAGAETGSFFVNTFLGFFGLFDSAKTIKALNINDQEDLGQTFGKWGIGPGPYLVLPFLGPSNLRDAIGYAGGFYADNWMMLEAFSSKEKSIMKGTDAINSIPGTMDMYNTLKDSAIDPYTALRDGYNQLRNSKIKK